MSIRASLALFCVFTLIGLAVSFHSLTYDWYWDDLHLIRVFTPAELQSVWVGHFDIDGIETAGYRPLVVVFNHLRALILGENVVAHRIFQIALMAFALTLFGQIAAQLGISWVVIALGGIFAICARYNWFNLVWLADAIHSFTAVLLFLSALMLLSCLSQSSKIALVLCIFYAGSALLVREDAVAMFPVIIGFGLFKITNELDMATLLQMVQKQPPALHAKLKRIGIVVISLALIALGYFLLRNIFVPRAPFRINVLTWWYQIWLTLYPLGHPISLWQDAWLRDAWKLVAVVLMLATLLILLARSRREALFFLASVVIVSSAGLVVARINVLFFSILFYSMWLATVLIGLTTRSRVMTVFVFMVVCVFLILSAERSMLAQTVMHPQSLERIETTYDIISRTKVTVPSERYERITAAWAQAGIISLREYPRLFPAIAEQARKDNRRFPNDEGKLFVPLISFLEP